MGMVSVERTTIKKVKDNLEELMIDLCDVTPSLTALEGKNPYRTTNNMGISNKEIITAVPTVIGSQYRGGSSVESSLSPSGN